ncbi:MAG: hypothetical protein LBE16_03640 [Clostridiales Family XIII bacterium]|jgi:hypothetical protein|nr:hypothetical protein [Clostridiales Family XIII bacterium]
MAKSLGEVNYEYLVEFFGSASGHEDFFTSDDGEALLVFPPQSRASAFAEGSGEGDARVLAQDDPVASGFARDEGDETVSQGHLDVSPSGKGNARARLRRGALALGRVLARRTRGEA